MAEIESLNNRGAWLPKSAAALEVLGMTGLERAHQAYIAWLLDPGGSHGLGPAVLQTLLASLGRAGLNLGELTAATVKIEDARKDSRADIVVAMAEHTLVIELKIYSREREGQTRRQADDHATSPGPVYAYLTLTGAAPSDHRFQAKALREVAEAARAALAGTAPARGSNEARGRATAEDYLYVLEGMCGMGPISQQAAAFWLRYGADMDQAKSDAARLLTMIPEKAETVLASMADDLGDGLAVTRFHYPATGSRGTYDEVGVLIYRHSWQDGSSTWPRFGVGMGQRAEVKDSLNSYQRPFYGVWAADAADRLVLRGDGAEWSNWAWWQYMDLEPPHDQSVDVLDWYGQRVANDIKGIWRGHIDQIDIVAGIADRTAAEKEKATSVHLPGSSADQVRRDSAKNVDAITIRLTSTSR